MKALKRVAIAGILACMLSTVYGIDLGENITISDRMNNGTDPSKSAAWWSDREDNEVEPGILWYGQSYDLEAMMLDGRKLSVVGGYNFWNPPSQTTMQPGDLFIDVDGDVKYGNPGLGGSGNTAEPNLWGYDYVYDIDFDKNTYDVFAIDETTRLLNVLYGDPKNIDTRGSNAWAYDSSLYPDATPLFSGTLTYWDNLTDADLAAYGLVGAADWNNAQYNNRHYAIQVDLAGLGLQSGTIFTAHYTMQCGNDNLMGQGISVPDGGLTLAFLGCALLGMSVWKRTSRS